MSLKIYTFSSVIKFTHISFAGDANVDVHQSSSNEEGQFSGSLLNVQCEQMPDTW